MRTNDLFSRSELRSELLRFKGELKLIGTVISDSHRGDKRELLDELGDFDRRADDLLGFCV